MSNANFERQLRATIERFVLELSDIVRSAALQSVTEAFGGSAISGPESRRGARSSKSTAARAGAARGRGQKRPPQELAALVDRLFEAVKANPGLRMEQIAESLGSSTQELALPAKKLLSEKKIKTKGERRATKYFPA